MDLPEITHEKRKGLFGKELELRVTGILSHGGTSEDFSGFLRESELQGRSIREIRRRQAP
ncbi:hypothetical protein BD309DRAFT_971264 [Dichomitus squalens]|nr:hypothetical protein BD309DRAFT_971264 [Dichomitus squalens]